MFKKLELNMRIIIKKLLLIIFVFATFTQGQHIDEHHLLKTGLSCFAPVLYNKIVGTSMAYESLQMRFITANDFRKNDADRIYGHYQLASDSIPGSKDSKRFIYLGIKSGYRFNLYSTPLLNSNFYFGFLIELPLSHTVSLQPEVNFWKTVIKSPIHQINLSVIDIPLNLILKANLENKGFSFLFGLGIIFENNRDNLISLNFGGNFWIDINQSLRFSSQIRMQKSGSLEPGGGDTVTSLMLGIGLQVPINK